MRRLWYSMARGGGGGGSCNAQAWTPVCGQQVGEKYETMRASVCVCVCVCVSVCVSVCVCVNG